MNRILIYTITGLCGALLLGVGVWFVFFRTPAAVIDTSGQQQTFPMTANQSTVPVTAAPQADTNQPQALTATGQTKKIFKLADGPVAGAVILQMGRPTTTVARYIMANTGRVFEVPLGSAGAVTRIVSNTTIPGLMRAQWAEGGAAVVGQYIDEGVVKTLYLGFPAARTSPSPTSTLTQAIKIQYLPDDIADFAISPDGGSVAYLLRTSAGMSGYIAKSGGSGSRKVFSTPLSQALLAWPAAGSLVVQSPAAAGVAGIAFSVDVKSGTVSPLVYANGLTITADRGFSWAVYQIAETAGRSTYLHNIKTGLDQALSFDPFPEHCAWSRVASTSANMYCFLPLSYVPPSYLDLWHLGAAAAADSIFLFDTNTRRSSLVTVPGGADGGVPATIAEIALAPDDSYLLYISKGDRALWGVRMSF